MQQRRSLFVMFILCHLSSYVRVYSKIGTKKEANNVGRSQLGWAQQQIFTKPRAYDTKFQRNVTKVQEFH
jgi:hypothetical protein